MSIVVVKEWWKCEPASQQKPLIVLFLPLWMDVMRLQRYKILSRR